MMKSCKMELKAGLTTLPGSVIQATGTEEDLRISSRISSTTSNKLQDSSSLQLMQRKRRKRKKRRQNSKRQHLQIRRLQVPIILG